jgi:hypothetical protein
MYVCAQHQKFRQRTSNKAFQRHRILGEAIDTEIYNSSPFTLCSLVAETHRSAVEFDDARLRKGNKRGRGIETKKAARIEVLREGRLLEL